MNRRYFRYNQDVLQNPTFEGLMSGTERPRFPDLSLGRSTFKRAVEVDMSGEHGEIIMTHWVSKSRSRDNTYLL